MDRLLGVTKKRKSRRQSVLFGAVFLVCLVSLGGAYMLLRESELFAPFLDFNAGLAGSVLNLFGARTEVVGAVVSGGDFSFRVTAECTSTVFTAILAAAVLAWPSRPKEKLIGLMAGAVTLFVINLVRIVTLYYIGAAFPWFLDIAHFFLWQIALILITIGVWVLWSEKIVGKQE